MSAICRAAFPSDECVPSDEGRCVAAFSIAERSRLWNTAIR
jgi:hypothetical protein